MGGGDQGLEYLGGGGGGSGEVGVLRGAGGGTNFQLAKIDRGASPSPHSPGTKILNSTNPFAALCAHSKCQSAICLLLVTSILCLKSDEYIYRAREKFGL